MISANTFISYADGSILVIRPLSEKDSRYQYPNKLLKHILEKTEAQYSENGKFEAGIFRDHKRITFIPMSNF